MRYTRITTNDAVDVIVPNSEFINGRVVNWTFGEQFRRMHVSFGVAYGADKELVREAGFGGGARCRLYSRNQRRGIEVWLVGFRRQQPRFRTGGVVDLVGRWPRQGQRRLPFGARDRGSVVVASRFHSPARSELAWRRVEVSLVADGAGRTGAGMSESVE